MAVQRIRIDYNTATGAINVEGPNNERDFYGIVELAKARMAERFRQQRPGSNGPGIVKPPPGLDEHGVLRNRRK